MGPGPTGRQHPSKKGGGLVHVSGRVRAIEVKESNVSVPHRALLGTQNSSKHMFSKQNPRKVVGAALGAGVGAEVGLGVLLLFNLRVLPKIGSASAISSVCCGPGPGPGPGLPFLALTVPLGHLRVLHSEQSTLGALEGNSEGGADLEDFLRLR